MKMAMEVSVRSRSQLQITER